MNTLREFMSDVLHAATVAGWVGGILFLYFVYVLSANGVIQW